VVLTADPLTVEPSAILGIDIEETFADGVMVYGTSSTGNSGGPSGR
jgi:hypothetical protein